MNQQLPHDPEETLSKQLMIEEDRYDSFRQIRKGVVAFGRYQKRLFIMMGFYWITASFFLILPFYFFKMPIYCLNKQIEPASHCIRTKIVIVACTGSCIEEMCEKMGPDIGHYVVHEHTLTYKFNFFCQNQFWRMFYKISTESMAWVGLLLYGYIGDRKGRKLAFKISWRFYTIGLIFFTFTNTPFLISFGYFIACINCFPSLVIQFVLFFEQLSPSIRVLACYLLLSFLLIAPLLASLLSGFLIDLGRTWTLTILCTVPSIILSLVTGFVEQSALFIYRTSKIQSFSILNKIAKLNGSPPFIIDLSRSYWRKMTAYNPGVKQMFQHPGTRNKLLLGIFMSFGFYYNRRMAQIELDPFTDQYIRGYFMNGASTVATLTVIVLFTRFKLKNLRWVTILTPFLVLTDLIVTILSENGYAFQTVITILIRYFSDFGYSMFLIWAIESYPTVCRTKCVGLVLSGISLGSLLAYIFRPMPIVQLSFSLGVSILLVWFSKYLKLDYNHRLMDTLSGNWYDRYDQFKKVESGKMIDSGKIQK